MCSFLTMSDRSSMFTLKFIRAYKNNPCLWQLTHPDYRRKSKKDIAYNELLQILKCKDIEANLCSVSKRINMLRNCFNKELNKVKRSMEKGDGNIHVPKLWYYHELRFLADLHTMPKGATKNEVQKDKNEDEKDDEDDDNQSENWSREHIEAPTASTSHGFSSKPKTKMFIKPKAFESLLPNLSKKLDKPIQKLKYSAFGEHVAEKLRSMPPLMVTYCQKIINDAIFLAETNNLDINSHISEVNPLHVQNDSLSNEINFKVESSEEQLYEEDDIEMKFTIEKEWDLSQTK